VIAPSLRPVVTGVGVRVANAADIAAFTEVLAAGRSGVTEVAGPDQPSLGAELTDLDFSGEARRRSALGEQLLDRAGRIGRRATLTAQASLLVAMQAWEHAALHLRPLDPERISIVVAGHNLAGRYTEGQWRQLAGNPAYLRPSTALQHQDSFGVAAVSSALGITGEGSTVGAASASGNAALIHGIRLLVTGAADACLVVGAVTELSSLQRRAYLNLGAMAAWDEHRDAATQCRPFDAGRAGFVPGQGAAAALLETTASAAQRGQPALATVLGGATRLDANHSADPSVAGEVSAMAAALRVAGLDAGDVDYLNAHGTGSPLGDDTEVQAIQEVFHGVLDRVWVNATKAITGHCLSSAGVVEAVATIAQLRGGFVHPNPNLSAPVGPLRFARTKAAPATIEVAMSNGFGFGGFNTSVLFGRAG